MKHQAVRPSLRSLGRETLADRERRLQRLESLLNRLCARQRLDAPGLQRRLDLRLGLSTEEDPT